jgi:hypothetical protein
VLLIVAAAALLSAILSLGSTAQSWRKLSDGTVDALTLTDLTGITRRRELDKVFARIIGTELYTVNAYDIDKARTKLHRLLSDPTHDALSAFIALLGAMLWSWPLVGVAAAYELASWAWAIKTLARSREDEQDR